MSKQYVVRLISSQDHDMSRKELVGYIRETGRDRYDENRKQMFDEFYGKHNVDFFGSIVESSELQESIERMKSEFGAKTAGDRGRHVVPDIAIVYDADKCRMIEHVYEDRITSDCFQFVGNPLEILVDVREV